MKSVRRCQCLCGKRKVKSDFRYLAQLNAQRHFWPQRGCGRKHVCTRRRMNCQVCRIVSIADTPLNPQTKLQRHPDMNSFKQMYVHQKRRFRPRKKSGKSIIHWRESLFHHLRDHPVQTNDSRPVWRAYDHVALRPLHRSLRHYGHPLCACFQFCPILAYPGSPCPAGRSL